jgi:hypothetical protein
VGPAADYSSKGLWHILVLTFSAVHGVHCGDLACALPPLVSRNERQSERENPFGKSVQEKQAGCG